MPPFIRVRQPPDDSWVVFDLAVPSTIYVRQPPDARWVPFVVGGGGALPAGINYDDHLVWNGATWEPQPDLDLILPAPIGASDKSPLIHAALVAEAAGLRRRVVCPKGDWNINTTMLQPPHTSLFFADGARIIGNTPAGAMFGINTGYTGLTTTLVSFVDDQAVVTSSAGFVVGDEIEIDDVAVIWMQAGYIIRGIVGNTLTLDRSIKRAFGAGSTVRQWNLPAENLRIAGESVEVTGAAVRAFWYVATRNSVIEGFNIDGSALTDMGASFDVCGYRNTMRQMRVTDLPGGAVGGLALEVDEDSIIEDSEVLRSGANGILVYDGWGCGLRRVAGDQCAGAAGAVAFVSEATGPYCRHCWADEVQVANSTIGFQDVGGSLNAIGSITAKDCASSVVLFCQACTVDLVTTEGGATGISATANGTRIGVAVIRGATTAVVNGGDLGIGSLTCVDCVSAILHNGGFLQCNELNVVGTIVSSGYQLNLSSDAQLKKLRFDTNLLASVGMSVTGNGVRVSVDDFCCRAAYSWDTGAGSFLYVSGLWSEAGSTYANPVPVGTVDSSFAYHVPH